MPDGSPSWADPRYVLRRALSKAADRGFTFYTHPEIEFFLLKNRPTDGSEPQPIDNGGYFDMTSHDIAHDFRRDGRGRAGGARHLGRVQPPRGRAGPAGDRPALRRRAVHGRQHHDVPARHQGGRDGRRACTPPSCPSRSAHQPGSGMHTHLSLFEGDRNAFHDPSDELNLSKTARAFIAGLLRHAREITAVTNQWVNSYKRLFGCADAAASWSRRRPTSAGGTRTGRRWSGCRCTSRARPTRPGSRCARWTRPATRTWPSR